MKLLQQQYHNSLTKDVHCTLFVLVLYYNR